MIKTRPGTLWVWLLSLLLLLAIACNKERSEPQPTGTEQSPAARAVGKTLAGVVVTLEGETYELQPRDGGYQTTGFKIKVEADRVKVKDAEGKELAKVKSKPDGFKLYQEGSEEAMLKGKRRGDGYKLLRKPVDEELGRVEGGGGTMGGDAVTVKDGQVSRGGKVVAEVKGNVPATAAALLAATELSKAERLAMFVFAVEIAK